MKSKINQITIKCSTAKISLRQHYVMLCDTNSVISNITNHLDAYVRSNATTKIYVYYFTEQTDKVIFFIKRQNFTLTSRLE